MQKDITKEIVQIQWHHLGKWIEPALAAEVWLEYGQVAQKFFKQKLDGKILYLNGDFFLSQHDVDLIQTESYQAAKTKNRKFFTTIEKEVKQVTDNLTKRVMKVRSLSVFLEDYKMLTGVWMPLNIIALGIEKFIQEENPKAFGMVKGYVKEKPWTFQQIDEMNQLKLLINKSAGKSVKKVKDIPFNLQKKVSAHVNKYEWLGTHHFNVNQFTVEKLIERFNQKTNENKKLAAVNIKDKYLVELLDTIGFVRFKCAETSGYVTYYLKDRLEFLAKKHKLSYSEIVEHTLKEIKQGQINKRQAVDRKKNTGFYFDGQSEYILAAGGIKTLLSRLLKPQESNAEEIKGLVAQPGKVSGIVKIVTRQDQMSGFEEGMILVAYETTPDIIFAMQKCAAIVTDFGGLTSHAAIVARELKKPCIVGTKNATKVLKDGDLVEVDAEKGTVRLIK